MVKTTETTTTKTTRRGPQSQRRPLRQDDGDYDHKDDAFLYVKVLRHGSSCSILAKRAMVDFAEFSIPEYTLLQGFWNPFKTGKRKICESIVMPEFGVGLMDVCRAR